MRFLKFVNFFFQIYASQISQQLLGRQSRDLSYWNRIYNGLNVQIGSLEGVSPVVCQIYLHARNNQASRNRRKLLNMLNQHCNSLKTTPSYK